MLQVHISLGRATFLHPGGMSKKREISAEVLKWKSGSAGGFLAGNSPTYLVGIAYSGDRGTNALTM